MSGASWCCWCGKAVLEGQAAAGPRAGQGVCCPVLPAAANNFKPTQAMINVNCRHDKKLQAIELFHLWEIHIAQKTSQWYKWLPQFL